MNELKILLLALQDKLRDSLDNEDLNHASQLCDDIKLIISSIYVLEVHE